MNLFIYLFNLYLYQEYLSWNDVVHLQYKAACVNSNKNLANLHPPIHFADCSGVSLYFQMGEVTASWVRLLLTSWAKVTPILVSAPIPDNVPLSYILWEEMWARKLAWLILLDLHIFKSEEENKPLVWDRLEHIIRECASWRRYGCMEEAWLVTGPTIIFF
jgi:hypothetical protein